MRTPAVAYDIEECMLGVEEDAPNVEARNGYAINYRPEQRNFILSVLVKVVGGIEGKEDNGFLETPLMDHLFWGWEFQLGKQLKFTAVNHD